jgi:hypothetical protein
MRFVRARNFVESLSYFYTSTQPESFETIIEYKKRNENCKSSCKLKRNLSGWKHFFPCSRNISDVAVSVYMTCNDCSCNKVESERKFLLVCWFCAFFPLIIIFSRVMIIVSIRVSVHFHIQKAKNAQNDCGTQQTMFDKNV